MPVKILRVLNNNIVLSRDDSGQEVILTGRGLGFQKRAGQEVDPSAVVRTFVPTDGRDPDNLATILAAIDQEVVRAVVLAISETQLEPSESTQPTLAIAVADHVAQALKREREGARIEYPLRAEGKGETEPVADNTTADGRAANRRVVISIASPARETTEEAVQTELPEFAGTVARGDEGVRLRWSTRGRA